MKRIDFSDYLLQGSAIINLREQIEKKRLVHAIMISGEPGTGKSTLARLLASALVCKAETGVPCGICAGCRMAANKEHPDIVSIEKGVPLSSDTAKGRSTIPVDDIRELIRICSTYTYGGGNRVVIINNAENMTVQAQNSLLKILEEPPHNTYFLITSAHPDQILITVRSRCRPVKLIPWPEDYIRQILSDSGIDPEMAAKSASVAFGSIGTAFRLASDDIYWRIREEILDTFFRNRRRSEILKISAGWKDRKSEAESVFSILEEELQKLFRYHLNPDGNQDISQFPDPWQKFAAYASKESFLNLMEKIKDARKQHAFNVNFQTIIEQLILIFLGESDLWAN